MTYFSSTLFVLGLNLILGGGCLDTAVSPCVLYASTVILAASDWPERLRALANQLVQHPDGDLRESRLIHTLNTEQPGTQ